MGCVTIQIQTFLFFSHSGYGVNTQTTEPDEFKGNSSICDPGCFSYVWSINSLRFHSDLGNAYSCNSVDPDKGHKPPRNSKCPHQHAVYHVYHSSACQHDINLLISSKFAHQQYYTSSEVQPKLTGISFVLQIFGHKQKYWVSKLYFLGDVSVYTKCGYLILDQSGGLTNRPDIVIPKLIPVGFKYTLQRSLLFQSLQVRFSSQCKRF